MEVWIEILETLRKNKLRTFLTGFSVAWGIFILIVLVSMGSGIRGFVSGIFGNDMNNTMYIYPRMTSLPFNGSNPGRKIEFENKDMDAVVRNLDVDIYSPRLMLNQNQIRYGKEKGAFVIRAVTPDHRYIEASSMVSGRFINQLDYEENRKCAVIGRLAKNQLFKDKNALGEYIEINGIPFKIVGVHADESEADEERMIYLPVTTVQKVFSRGDEISVIVVTINEPSLEKSLVSKQKLKETLGAMNNFDPMDDRALYVSNKMETTERTFQLLDSIKLFTIFIGVLSIISGSIGVMNIMVISVKERTKEIGLRRALGANPQMIISSIIKEAVFITLFFGYVGLLSSAGLLSLINSLAGEDATFKNLVVDVPLALVATGVLVFVGAIAGLIPAVKASRIRPVEALNDN